MFEKLSKLFIVLSIMVSTHLNAQNINSFYSEISIASNLAESGEVDEAILTYENAFKKIDYVRIRYLNKVLTLAKENNDLERVSNYSERIKKQRKGKKPHLIKVIDSLMQEDQKVRTNKSAKRWRYMAKCDANPNCNKNSKKYIKSKLTVDNWKRTDSLNIYSLLNLIELYGFIDEELIGPEKAESVFILLLHFDADTNNSVLEPVLKRALNEGKIEPKWYTMILDRHLGGDFAKQIYWTWPDSSKERYPITEDDIPEILKMRESIGLYNSVLKLERRRGYWIIANN